MTRYVDHNNVKLHSWHSYVLFYVGKSTSLQQGAYGLVFLACGGATPIESSTNVFTFAADEEFIDKSMKKPAEAHQKPVDFFARMAELFTSPDDWILEGICKTGNNN